MLEPLKQQQFIDHSSHYNYRVWITVSGTGYIERFPHEELEVLKMIDEQQQIKGDINTNNIMQNLINNNFINSSAIGQQFQLTLQGKNYMKNGIYRQTEQVIVNNHHTTSITGNNNQVGQNISSRAITGNNNQIGQNISSKKELNKRKKNYLIELCCNFIKNFLSELGFLG